MRYRRLSLYAAIALTTAAGGGPVWSQDATVVYEAEAPTSGAGLGEDTIRDVSEMVGVAVFNALDEEIAEIDALLVRGDRIVFARLGIGGFLGFGGRELIVPFSVLDFRSSAAEAGRDPELQAVIETVRTPDQLRMLTPPDALGEAAVR